MRPLLSAASILLFTLFLAGCVTHTPNGSWEWKPFKTLSKNTTPATSASVAATPSTVNQVDVYLATFQGASWDMWDKIRQNPETNRALAAGTIRIRFLSEALMLASFGNAPMIADDELSLPPALFYEGLHGKDNKLAFAYLDFMSKNRGLIHRELDQTKRAATNKKLHTLIDIWLKAQGYAAGTQGLFASMGEGPVKNLLAHWQTFRTITPQGETLATPVVAVDGKENASALFKKAR